MKPVLDEFYVVCFNRYGYSYKGPFKSREEAERVAEVERAKTQTGRIIRPRFGPLSKWSDEPLTFKVYGHVEVRQGIDYF